MIEAAISSLTAGERLLYLDESGPLYAKPTDGRSWSPKKLPLLVPSQWKNKGKVELLAGVDIDNKQITFHLSRTKRHTDIISLLEKIGNKYSCYQKVYLVWDNFASHKAKGLTQWIEKWNKNSLFLNRCRFELLFLPTFSPWLNPIESIFGVIKKRALANSDFQSADELKIALSQTIEDHNRKSFHKEQNKVELNHEMKYQIEPLFI